MLQTHSLFVNHKRWKLFFSLAVAIDLIVQHIREFLSNRGRSIEPESSSSKVQANEESSDDGSTSAPTTPVHGKKKTESHTHSMHRPH